MDYADGAGFSGSVAVDQVSLGDLTVIEQVFGAVEQKTSSEGSLGSVVSRIDFSRYMGSRL